MEKLYSFPLSELDPKAPVQGTKGHVVSGPCLHYSAPSAGGWSIVRTALLVPESVMLFVAPHGCGRHGSVACMQLGLRPRIHYMDVSEEDLVLGLHVERIDEVVDHILASRKTRPKAFFICASCIDDLLATDYKTIIRGLTAKHGIPFMDCHMNPITANSHMPPPLNIQRSVYSFLSSTPETRVPQNTVNLVGNFSPVVQASEFYQLMHRAGFDQVLQVSDCQTFAEYMRMQNSSHNILLKPPGRAACQDMERRLGIPWTKQFVRYSPDSVRRTYDELADFLGRPIEYAPYFEKCLESRAQRSKRLKGVRVGVGANVNGSPFEIADALAECGLEIAFIMSTNVMDYEWEYVERLKKRCGEIPIYTNYHPSMAMIETIPEAADVAIGFDASYICPSARLFVLDNDIQHYGFEAADALLEGVEDALHSDISAKKIMYSKGLVV